MTIGENIKRLREKKNISQKQLAGTAGVSLCVISLLENGKSKAQRKTLIKIAKALRVDLKDLTAEKSDSEPVEVFDAYQKLVIHRAINLRIQWEAERLAVGTGKTVEQILEEYYSEDSFSKRGGGV